MKKLKIGIFPKGLGPWFWSKIGIFFIFFILGKIGEENVFHYIPERKDAFLEAKSEKFKKSKNWDFSKGVSHGFGPKLTVFPSFYFS